MSAFPCWNPLGLELCTRERWYNVSGDGGQHSGAERCSWVCPQPFTSVWDPGFGVGCAKSVSGVKEQLGELLVKLNPKSGRRMRTQSQEATGGA